MGCWIEQTFTVSFCVLSWCQGLPPCSVCALHLHLTSDLLRLPGQSQQRQAPWGSPKRKVIGSGRLRSQHTLSSFLSHLFICPGLIAGHPFHRLWLGTYCVPRTVLSAENTFDVNVWSLTSRKSKAIDVNSKICSVAMKFIPWKGLHSSIIISTFCRKITAELEKIKIDHPCQDRSKC